MGNFLSESLGVSTVKHAPPCDLPRNILDCQGVGLPQARRWSIEMAAQYSEMICRYQMDSSGLILVSGDGDWMSFVEQGIEESWTGGYEAVSDSKKHGSYLFERSLILESRAWRESLSKELLLEVQQRYSVAKNIMLIPGASALEILLRRSFIESYLDGVNSAILESRRNRRSAAAKARATTRIFQQKTKIPAPQPRQDRRSATA